MTPLVQKFVYILLVIVGIYIIYDWYYLRFTYQQSQKDLYDYVDYKFNILQNFFKSNKVEQFDNNYSGKNPSSGLADENILMQQIDNTLNQYSHVPLAEHSSSTDTLYNLYQKQVGNVFDVDKPSTTLGSWPLKNDYLTDDWFSKYKKEPVNLDFNKEQRVVLPRTDLYDVDYKYLYEPPHNSTNVNIETHAKQLVEDTCIHNNTLTNDYTYDPTKYKVRPINDFFANDYRQQYYNVN